MEWGLIAPLFPERKYLTTVLVRRAYYSQINVCVARPLIVGTDHTPDYLYMPPGGHVLLF